MNTNNAVLEQLVTSDPLVRQAIRQRLQAKLEETNATAKELQSALNGLEVVPTVKGKAAAKAAGSNGKPGPRTAPASKGKVNPEGKTGRVLEYVRQHPNTPAKAIIEHFSPEGISGAHIHTMLNKLMKGGHVVKDGARNHGTYRA